MWKQIIPILRQATFRGLDTEWPLSKTFLEEDQIRKEEGEEEPVLLKLK